MIEDFDLCEIVEENDQPQTILVVDDEKVVSQIQSVLETPLNGNDKQITEDLKLFLTQTMGYHQEHVNHMINENGVQNIESLLSKILK